MEASKLDKNWRNCELAAASNFRVRDGDGSRPRLDVGVVEFLWRETLELGTLNVEMDREVPVREHFQIKELKGHEWGWGGPVRFEICRINSLWAYRIKGGHPPLIAEIAVRSAFPKAQETAWS